MAKHPVVINYQLFKKLPLTEQQKRAEAWDKYYEDVKKSVTYAIFQAQRTAAKKNDWGRIRELGLEIRSMQQDGALPVLQKPAYTDPFEFFSAGSVVKQFQEVEKEIKALTDYPYITQTQELQAGKETFSE